jgi:hypothetical protein
VRSLTLPPHQLPQLPQHTQDDVYKAAHRFYEKNGFSEIKKAELPPNFPLLQVDTKFYKYNL